MSSSCRRTPALCVVSWFAFAMAAVQHLQPDREHVPSTLEGLLVVLQFVFSSGSSVLCSCRNFGTRNITLMLPQVLYVVMCRSETSVRSTRGRSRTSRWVVHSSVHHDGYASVLGLRVVWYTTLRRPQRQLLRQRVQSKDCAAALRGSGFRCFCRKCAFCALLVCRW